MTDDFKNCSERPRTRTVNLLCRWSTASSTTCPQNAFSLFY